VFRTADEVRRVCDFTESRAKAVQVAVELELVEDLILYGDSIRFDQIIANLVANAIDAYEGFKRAETRRVVISTRKKDEYMIIRVKDYAAGIEPAELANIFEAFYTTKTPERGSGLGLSIIKQTIEHDFHGSITVSSKPYRGTCFTIVLPITGPLRV
jgi:C4-dicarboxylate-specific signal transduction histidine kinase